MQDRRAADATRRAGFPARWKPPRGRQAAVDGTGALRQQEVVQARSRPTGRRSLAALGGVVAVAALLAAGRAEARPGQSFEEAQEHWAYQPVKRPAAPSVQAADRVQTPVDAFLLARLEDQGLTFSSPAKARTLLRRVYFDLIGLPPTVEEIEAFEKSATHNPPSAVAQVVDRLLADPRYGERWGRHWLDVARYADTKDLVLLYGKDAVRPYAYTYRDYVIRAFNEDVPFDEFVRDQLAADLVRPALPPWRLAALGFLTLGRLFDNNVHDQLDDQIDTVTRGLLGLTVSCARCHDHKYDAITMTDYYGLYGVFASTERPYVEPLIENPAEVPGGLEFETKLAGARNKLEDHMDAEFARLTADFRGRLGDYLAEAGTTKPGLWETTQFALSLTPENFRPALLQRTRRFLKARAKPEDRVFGPWAVLMAKGDAELAGGAAAPLTATNAGPADWNPMVLAALADAEVTNRLAVARAYAGLFQRFHGTNLARACGEEAHFFTADERELLDVLSGPDSPVAFERRDTPDHMSRPQKDRYNALVLGLDKLAAHATTAPPARAMVVADLPSPHEARIFGRGNPSRPGDPVARGFLRVLNDGREQPFGEGSGRLDLARAITAPDNPLTARVLVNRVWMHHFGEPLVASTADFGTRSPLPTHPELLDWLASEFMASGWSLKSLHRVMVLSAAYQQAPAVATSEASESDSHTPLVTAGAQVDPDSKLLWHFPRRRLDVEAMRDSLLFLAGRLDPALGGRPEDVTGDPLNRRRTVYGLVDRQNLAGLLRAFDFASPDQCAERRPRTTVPQQALFAMNSAFVQEQARALAARPEIAGESGPEQRVDALFRRVLGRPASDREVAASLRFVEAGGDDSGMSPWEQLAQVLLMSNEAVFVD